MVKEKGYENRSLAIADMIRDQLVAHWREAGEFDAVGTIMLAYDPNDDRVRVTLGKLQGRYLDTIVSTLCVQSDAQSCMEVLVVRGQASAIKALSDRLIGAKGVKRFVLGGSLEKYTRWDLPYGMGLGLLAGGACVTTRSIANSSAPSAATP